jgi:hypothetical protein
MDHQDMNQQHDMVKRWSMEEADVEGLLTEVTDSFLPHFFLPRLFLTARCLAAMSSL